MEGSGGHEGLNQEECMGRLSQIFWAINADNYPTQQEQTHFYTHLDLSGENGETIKKIRRSRTYEQRRLFGADEG